MVEISLPRTFVVGILILIAGCATQTSRVYHSPDAHAPPIDASVVILPADVEISRLTAGGIPELRADWSSTVSANLHSVLAEALYQKGIRFVDYGETLADEDMNAIRQVNVLLDAIELSQIQKTIGGDRDYVVGEAEKSRLQAHGAQYALLIVLRAERATAGRVAAAVLTGIASWGTATVSTSSLVFRSVLIDLSDGHIKWANFDAEALQDIGDLLTAKPRKWEKGVDHILSGFPL